MRVLPAADRWLLAWSTGYAAVGAASLLVPLYAIQLGAGPLEVGLVAATAAIAGVPGALLWGRLAERTGRHRAFVLISLALTAATLAVLPRTRSVTAVLVANAGLWFAVSAAAPVLTLLVVADAQPTDWDRRIGRLNSYQGYGWLGGLLAGAAWNAVGARVVPPTVVLRVFFSVLAATTLIALLAGYRFFPGSTTTIAAFGRSRRAVERLVRGSGRRVGLNPISPLRIFWSVRSLHPRTLLMGVPRSLLSYLVAIFLAFTGFAVFFGPLPTYLTAEAGLTTGDVFLVFLVSSAASALCYTRVGRLASRRGPYLPQFGALVTRVLLFPVVGAIVLLPRHELAVLILSFAVIGTTWAVIAVTAAGIVTRLAPTTLRGDALGAYTALVGLATAIGSLLGGAIATATDYLVTFALAGGLVLLGLVVAYGQYRRRGHTSGHTA